MKKWQLLPQIPAEFSRAYSDINPIVLQLLYNRGLQEKKAIAEFLSGETAFHDPFLFKNMAAAVDLIISHIKKGSRLMVYGDYDADGVTSSVILSETLKILHGQTEVYLPDRVSEGYGLNKMAIDQIAARGFKLIITVDNGIRNQAEVAYAQSLGLEVIITDHHVLPEDEKDLPDCLYIDPADPRDNYPWPYLAGVGVAFKLISALLAKADLSENQKRLIGEKCLDLVAVGTVADLVSLLGENRLLVSRGLQILNQSRRLGLTELIKIAKANHNRPLEAWNIGWQIGPRLNAASRLAHANSAFALLTTVVPEEARRLAEELNERNISRQKITAEITAAVEEQIDPANLPLVIIGVAEVDRTWNEGVIGLVAGRISEKYYRPTLVITRLNEEEDTDKNSGQESAPKISFKGSGRSVPEFNLIAAVEAAADLLDKYGGHPMACGFSLNNEKNLADFKQRLLKSAAEQLDPADLIPKLKVDLELKPEEITLDLIGQINALAPFGQDNPQPRFVSYGLTIGEIVIMGLNNQHIKFRLSSFWALAFGAAAEYKDFRDGDKVDVVYYLEINEFNGRKEVQLKIVDMRLASNQ
jgi:single-stranded-DNA-specific exonuclease